MEAQSENQSANSLLHMFEKPDKVTFRQFLYNDKTGAVLGRTGRSWFRVILFYIIFYLVLAGFVAICMWTFILTIDYRTPKYQLHESIIGTNPGLGIRPLPIEHPESTLITYRGTEKKDFMEWTDQLTEFLAPYKTPGLTPGRGQNIYACDYRNPPPNGKVCDVDIKSWYPCTLEFDYSYHKNAPCVFIKLNKIFGWIPEYYNDTNELPNEMPFTLKQTINEINHDRPYEMNTVWVSCDGENPADQENVGKIEYHPTAGFPGYYYPYNNTEGYLSPLVAVHFVKPARGIVINVECKAWAKNIKHNRKDRLGSVHFELMLS